MSLDDAIVDMKNKILAVSPGAEIKAVKMSDEEARLSVLAPAGNLDAIKSATLQPAMDFLNKDGFDIQVFAYDKDAPPLKG
jgi:hypothetical protein